MNLVFLFASVCVISESYVLNVGVRNNLMLRGGQCKLVVPQDFPTFERAVDFLESEKIGEAQISFQKGVHPVGAEEFEMKAMMLRNEKLNLKVAGEEGVELSGHLQISEGVGHFNDLRWFNVVKMAPDGFFFEEFGDNCVDVEGGEWTFENCEVQASGTAFRASEQSKVTCIRCLTGGTGRAKPPPSNWTNMNTPDYLREAMVTLLHRNPVTGQVLHPEFETSMPRYGFVAWDRAQVRLISCRFLNFTYNAICATGESHLEVEDCLIQGSRMAGLYMEGDSNSSVSRCVFKDNYICLSVWGGFGEERLLKTTSRMEDEPCTTVVPNCSLMLNGNRFHGMVWAGFTRPAHVKEADNVVESDEDMSEEPSEYSEFSGDQLLEPLPGTPPLGSRHQWRLEDPVSIPPWAPFDRPGGDGVCFWFPRNMSMALYTHDTPTKPRRYHVASRRQMRQQQSAMSTQASASGSAGQLP